MDKFSRHVYADISVNKRRFLVAVVRIYPNPNIVVPIHAFFYDFNSILWTDSPGAYKRVFSRFLNIHSISIYPRNLRGGMRNKLSSNSVKNHFPNVAIYAIHNFTILVIVFIFSCNYDSPRFLILESHYVHIRILFHFLFPFRPLACPLFPCCDYMIPRFRSFVNNYFAKILKKL